MPQPPCQLPVSQQTTLQSVIDILSSTETISDEYNDDEIDLDIDRYIQVA